MSIRFVAPSEFKVPSIVLLPVMNYSTPVFIEPVSKLKGFNYPDFEKSQSVQYSTFQLPPINPPISSPVYYPARRPQQYTTKRMLPFRPPDRSNTFAPNYPNSINRRDGWSGLSGKQSPAISALALLGFLFFLNLIQSSLQNNRLLLTTVPGNGTVLGSNIMFGRSGRVRRKRGFGNEHNTSTPEAILAHPNRQLLEDHALVKNSKNPLRDLDDTSKFSSEDLSTKTYPKKQLKIQQKARIKHLCNRCVCKFGRSYKGRGLYMKMKLCGLMGKCAAYCQRRMSTS